MCTVLESNYCSNVLFPGLMDTKHRSGGSDHHHAVKQAAAVANKHLPRTDNSDYLLPKSSMAYLDVIDDTGQFFTSDKEVLCNARRLFVFLSVCLFVCLLATLCKNY